MAIAKHDLEKMNELIGKGAKISELADQYPAHDYWEIYWAVNDYSFMGKKRSITNRLKKLVTVNSQSERKSLADEAQKTLDNLYNQLKENSSKLIEIDRILRK